MILESMHERTLLLKAGFTGKQIEALYFVLNRFESMGVNWDEAAVKPAGRFLVNLFRGVLDSSAAGTQDAPTRGVRA